LDGRIRRCRISDAVERAERNRERPEELPVLAQFLGRSLPPQSLRQKRRELALDVGGERIRSRDRQGRVREHGLRGKDDGAPEVGSYASGRDTQE
jgi:hypothetical protein